MSSSVRDYLVTVITYADEIHVHSTKIEEYKNEELFMRKFDVYYPAENFFEEIFSHLDKAVICGFIFVMGNTLKPSFMDSYPFRLGCRNYCRTENLPIAFTSFQCMEMCAAIQASNIPIHNLQNGDMVTVIAKIISSSRDLISCLPMQFQNGNFQISTIFLYFNPDIKSKEFQEDILKTKLMDSRFYIVTYPDEESHERYRKVYSSLNPVFIDRWDEDMTAKVNMGVSLHKLGIKYANFDVCFCPVIFKAVYGSKILFTSDEKFPMKKTAEILVDPSKVLKHEIHQKDWTPVVFTREISLINFTSPKATVTMEVDKDLCFKFDVQPSF